jgi:tRNA threonylcarbamoyladenosine biosynthesis protein TsaB
LPPNKLVLAFDTSAAHCAVALLLGDTVLAERVEEMNKGQAERLFPLLSEILDEAGKNWPDLDAIGVGIGPGNFTGIRLSVSAARGLALSLEKPAIGASMLEVLRFDTPGSVLALIDARRDQVYAQSSVGEEPQLIDIKTICDSFRSKIDVCIGHQAAEIAQSLGARSSSAKHSVAVAIARLAASRLHTQNARPAPLYLKAADAAASRDAPPVILA